jgi:hypothetical protein
MRKGGLSEIYNREKIFLIIINKRPKTLIKILIYDFRLAVYLRMVYC